jgi:hypothetical protein
MPKLTDTQAILLSTAAQRESGSVYPLSDKLTGGASVTKAVAGLLRSGLAEERETIAEDEVYRTEDDTRIGLYVTAAGLQAIGIAYGAAADEEAQAAAAPAERVTKAGRVLSLLQRDGGATLDELIAATGWLPHTTRAALTGLRKKGHEIERTKRDGDTCYRVASVA